MRARNGGFFLIPIGIPTIPLPNISQGSFEIRNTGTKTGLYVGFYRNSSRHLNIEWYDPATNKYTTTNPGCDGNFCAITAPIFVQPGAKGKIVFERNVFGDTWLIWLHVLHISGNQIVVPADETALQQKYTPAEFNKIPASRKRKITGLTFRTIPLQ
jgi:hypothetical protein